MRVSIQQLPKSQIEITIGIPAEEFKNFIEKAILDLGRDLEIPGFRKGKAPKESIEKAIGQEKILKEAAELAIKENYLKAILENKIEPLGQPEIQILKLAVNNPLEFKATVSVMPAMKLPDYKKIASQITKREVSVSEEEIKRLRLEKERMERERARQEILEKIAKDSELEIPEVLVIEEQRRMMENLKREVSQTLHISFEDYLAKINKTEQELSKSLLEETRNRVKNSLVLSEIEKRENVKVSEEEVQEEMGKISKIYPSLDQKQLKEYAERVIRNEKTLQFLESLSQ